MHFGCAGQTGQFALHIPAMHSTLSDDELVTLLRAGDEIAFVTLYRRRQGGIYRFALRMSGSEAIAEDVTQEVFMTLMRGDGHYEASRATRCGGVWRKTGSLSRFMTTTKTGNRQRRRV